jgi:antitoxin component YwqK of YwqJK toxin-antitoxin module
MTESGSVKEKSWFVNDELQGERIVFNRTRVKEESFYVDNVLHGKRSLYYDNGKIQEEGNFVNGKRDGIVRWYNQDEEVTIQTEYKNGDVVRQVPIE